METNKRLTLQELRETIGSYFRDTRAKHKTARILIQDILEWSMSNPYSCIGTLEACKLPFILKIEETIGTEDEVTLPKKQAKVWD